VRFGQLDGQVYLVRDISEKRILRDSLRQSQKLEAIGILTGGIAHDFNNALSIVIGYSSMVLEELKSNESAQGKVQLILDAAEKAAELTRQLLGYSRKTLIFPTSFNVNDEIKAFEKMVRRLIVASIDIKLELGSSLPEVYADSSSFDQVMMNLCLNARDAMQDGGTLIITSRRVDDYQALARDCVCVEVSDTGSGIPQAFQGKIFDPFFTTKEPGSGTGLGLSMVMGLVKQHGGAIEFDSIEGRGSVFKIYWPVQKIPVKKGKPVTAEKQVQGSESILIVEDNHALRQMMQHALQALGYSTHLAENANEAISILKENCGIDLIVTDLIMPGKVTIQDLVDYVTKNRLSSTFLFISGYGEEAVLKDYEFIRANENFLSKPFSPINLAKHVRKVLDLRDN